jgi:hypothetical protein
LLYVSGTDDDPCCEPVVNVYSYPAGELIGQLDISGWEGNGECVDPQGDVYVTTMQRTYQYGPAVYEYSHGGMQPIAELYDDDGQPVQCSFDSTTGNLAVVNENLLKANSVAIYADAEGTPTYYTSTNLQLFSCGYDNQGNLYVGGTPYDGGPFALVEVPHGGDELENITVDGIEGWANSIQWDGKHIAITSLARARHSHNTVYRVTFSGSAGSIVGKTVLRKPSFIGGQTWIQGGSILGPARGVDQWRYPRGGKGTVIVQDIGFLSGGVTISVAK